MTKHTLWWKIFSLKKNELGFAVPLFVLYFLSGSFFTIGQIYCETLFLKAHGAQGFSYFFIQNGIALVFTGIFYNYFLVRMDLKKGYFILMSLVLSIIIASSCLFKHNSRWVIFYLYMANYIFTFFLDLHFFNFASQYLSLRNSKRILPFVISGGKLGGITMSLIIFSFLHSIISSYGIYIWASTGLLLLTPLLILTSLKQALHIQPVKTGRVLRPDSSFFTKLSQKVKFSFSSPIFKFSVMAVLFMSIVNQISEYYFALSFNSIFTSKESLASFLSAYTFTADLITLFIGILLTSRVINFLGVRKSNLLYPGSFITFMLFFIAAPGLAAGIMLRFYRKNMTTLIRTPVYNIIMAASPRDRITEVKSFITSFITPLGMIIGGVLILIISSQVPVIAGYILSLSLGAVYIGLTVYQNRAYTQSLKDILSYDYSWRYTKKLDFTEYEAFLSKKTNIMYNKTIIEDLFNSNPAIEAAGILHPHFVMLSNATKSNILSLLKTGSFPFKTFVISTALSDRSPIIRAQALYLLRDESPGKQRELLTKNYHKGKLISERLTISYLLNRSKSRNTELFNTKFLIREINRIKKDILDNKLKPIEFIILVSTLPASLILGHLIELALKTKKIIFFKSLVPFADQINPSTGKILLNAFGHINIKLIISFILVFKKSKSEELAQLLDKHIQIPESQMERLFRYRSNEIIDRYVLKGLFLKKSYFNKSNYLNYLMIVNLKPQKVMTDFINHSMKDLTVIFDSRRQIFCLLNNAGIDYSIVLFRYLLLLHDDAIELYKHLVLKAISIKTGIDIDEAYESYTLIKDQDLNDYITEYIEVSDKNHKDFIQLFRKRLSFTDNKFPDASSFDKYTLTNSMEFLKSFIPDAVIPGSFDLIKESIIRDHHGSSLLLKSSTTGEDKNMLDLLEKLIFLKDNYLFSDLTATELIPIAQISREIEISKNQHILKKGSRGNELFIIVSGFVEVVNGTKVIATFGPGDCLGELSVIDEEPLDNDAKTIEKCRMLTIQRKDFLLTLKEHPNISIKIMKIIASRLRQHKYQ